MEKKREKSEPQEESASKEKRQQRERDRATVAIFFYPFLDHETNNQMWDIQTDQSAD